MSAAPVSDRWDLIAANPRVAVVVREMTGRVVSPQQLLPQGS